MSVAVQIDQVSKRYQLGVSRTSVIKAVTNGVQKVLKPGAQKSDESRELWALRDVSFDLSGGESLALVGRNGAGKSTMLKLLANITHPTSGRINVNGRLSALIELGSGFHPDLTGRENIFLNGSILGFSRAEIQRRYDEIVAFSEIERFIETPVKRYSSGMLVRLGFAIASCIEPDILLVDEVLAVGDASFRQKCLTRIQSLLGDGTSIIFVSHNLYMVQAICQRAIYLESGIVKYHGPTGEVINMYEHDLHEERAQKFEASQVGNEKIETDVHITQVSTLDKDGVSAEEFSSDQPLEVCVQYDMNGLPRPASVAIHVVRTDGLTCCMLRTKLDDVEFFIQKNGGTFSVVIEPLQLTGGTYYVNATILNEQDNIVLTTASSKWFYVKGKALSHEDLTGVFEPHGQWVMVNKIESSAMEEKEVYPRASIQS